MNTLFVIFLFLIICIYSILCLQVQVGSKFPGTDLPNKLKDDFDDAVDKLDYASLFIDRKKVSNVGGVRIDQQGSYKQTIGTGKKATKVTVYNMQAQLNDKKGKTTVAHVEIYETINDNKNQAEILKMAKKAFNDSEKDGKTRTLLP